MFHTAVVHAWLVLVTPRPLPPSYPALSLLPSLFAKRFWWDVVEERPTFGIGDTEEFAPAPAHDPAAENGAGPASGSTAADAASAASVGGDGTSFFSNIKAAFKEVATEILPAEPLPPPPEGSQQPTIAIRLSPPAPARRNQSQSQHPESLPALSRSPAPPPLPSAAAATFTPDTAVHLPTSTPNAGSAARHRPQAKFAITSSDDGGGGGGGENGNGASRDTAGSTAVVVGGTAASLAPLLPAPASMLKEQQWNDMLQDGPYVTSLTHPRGIDDSK